MRERGVDAVAMEVSSHALVLGRVDGAVFDVAVFTNLSPEHMDFHSGMEDYFQAKAQLFTPRRSRLGVVNLDDAYGRRLVDGGHRPGGHLLRRGPPGRRLARRGRRGRPARLAPSPPSAPRASGSRPPPRCPARSTSPTPSPRSSPWPPPGVDPQTAADGVAAVPGVPGRLERVDAGQPYLAVVDYAHKTDAVESVLRALRKVTEGRLHIVLGCGGDRDPTKRGPMGAAAARLADTAVLTSDNPRSEDPLAILAAMLAGAAEVPVARARRTSSSSPTGPPPSPPRSPRAEPGDTVLVAGKGHEQGQDIAGVIRPFDDREVLRAAIERRTPRRHPSVSPNEGHRPAVIALTLAEVAAGGRRAARTTYRTRRSGSPDRWSSTPARWARRLFAAFAGERVDGHDFAARAVAGGAVAVLATRPVGVPAIVVDDVRAALGALATARHRAARRRPWSPSPAPPARPAPRT